MKYSEEEKIQLYSFDLMTSGQSSEKISSAKAFFKSVFEDDETKLPLNVKHIILCPYTSCDSPDYDEKQPYNIICASWKELTI